MKSLTKAEEQIMQIIWELEKAFLGEILEVIPPPKPHHNTVATVLKILIEKKFIDVKVFGRMHQYYPIISKEKYSESTLRQMVKSFFGGSFPNAVSFMMRENKLSVDELETLIRQFKKSKK